jgi:Flp pilus assembly protein TadG
VSRTRVEALWADEVGAGAVEFALVGSALIAVLIGILMIGWGLQMRNELSHAADRVVRYVVMKPKASSAAVEAELRKALPRYDPARLEVATSTSKVGTVDYRIVTLRYPFGLNVPGMSAQTLTLTVSRRAPLL